MPGYYQQEGPYIELDTADNESLRGPREKYPGLITDLDQKVRECQVFTDALPHTLATFAIMPGRTLTIRSSVRAHDDAGGGRFAALDDIITVSRVANGAPAITLGGAAVLGFNPNAAPWNTMVAIPLLVGVNFVYQCTGIALATGIRWTVALTIMGSQAN